MKDNVFFSATLTPLNGIHLFSKHILPHCFCAQSACLRGWDDKNSQVWKWRTCIKAVFGHKYFLTERHQMRGGVWKWKLKKIVFEVHSKRQGSHRTSYPLLRYQLKHRFLLFLAIFMNITENEVFSHLSCTYEWRHELIRSFIWWHVSIIWNVRTTLVFRFMTPAQLEVKLGANSALEALNAHIPKNC